MKPTVGRVVHFCPPQSCVESGQTKIEKYASIVTQVNTDGTLELATFGPNSLYFQHNVPMYGQKFEMTDEHPAGVHMWGWMWPVREEA